MPPSQLGPAAALSAVGAVNARSVPGRVNVTPAAKTASVASAGVTVTATPTVETSAALDAGAAPVNTDRVQSIRKALTDGTYPLVPAKIGDAMIAAGMILRSPHS